ncbi:MAG: GspE/PulE family protein [Lentisphaeria bacterium]|jgi:type II secretory ATPase GspE/PulE/Tfp pilus assembly ATPase PilB-like protein|nr:GspE/PulE family protein [Lentisphaeria bacterium]
MEANDITRRAYELIQLASDSRASDLHLEAAEDGVQIRLRIDGVLQRQPTIPPGEGAELIRHFKQMAALNTDCCDRPQDGRVVLDAKGKRLDLRVSSLPTFRGERLVARLLDRSADLPLLADLGLHKDTLATIRKLCSLPSGVVLSTGPTGSGKTTLMYAMLMDLDREHCAVFSIEDPVEYELPGVSQTAVRPAAGVTFSRAARAIMRQDPDVIMVGEIRDLETAEISVQMALTGHLVFTQLHAATAPGALKRLLDMGIEPFLVNQSVRGVISQRLVRRLCPACKRPAKTNGCLLPDGVLERLNLDHADFAEPVGCDACRGTGYRGRRAIHEIILPDEKVQQAVMGGNLEAIRQAARENGMATLFEDGLRYAAAGITSLAEVARAAATCDWD